MISAGFSSKLCSVLFQKIDESESSTVTWIDRRGARMKFLGKCAGVLSDEMVATLKSTQKAEYIVFGCS